MKPKDKVDRRQNGETKQRKSSVTRIKNKQERRKINNRIRSGYIYDEDGSDREWPDST